MKAAIYYEFGKSLVVEEIEIDPPQAGEIKVKLTAVIIEWVFHQYHQYD